MTKFKDWTVKKMIRWGFLAIIISLTVVVISALIGMNVMGDANLEFQDRILPNTTYSWGMRRNILSLQRNLLLAMISTDEQEISDKLDAAQQDAQRVHEEYEKFSVNATRANPEKVAQLGKDLKRLTGIREEITELLRANTVEANQKAYQIYVTEYGSAIDESATLMIELGEEQERISADFARRANFVFRSSTATLFALFIFSIVLSIIIVKKVTKAILQPLQQMGTAVQALAKGDFDYEITYQSKNEFGVACELMQKSFAELKRIIAETTTAFGSMADGNFSISTSRTFSGEMSKIEDAAEKMLDRMNETFILIKQSANQISSGSEQVSAGAQALAQGATEQASSVQELSATLTEISNQVTSNSQNAQKASDLSTQMGELMQDAMVDMRGMLESIKNISATSENIGKVIKVIDDIAFQTNILALNAAVEAARAGMSGKGFAVVADEVRNLAAKSADAVKDTAILIEETMQAVQGGEKLVSKAFTGFEKVAEQSTEVVSTVNEIADESVKQANAISQITVGIDQISAVVQTNSATSEESAAASEELSSQAMLLRQTMEEFQLRSDDY